MNIIEALKKDNLTIATAESVTAGLVANEICNISGASEVFKGGIVSYTKQAKCSLLGLNMTDIEAYGVYSEETVLAMAKGVKNKLSVDVAIATSGVAGPDSDEGVDAGTVYFCFIVKDRIYIECKFFAGDRNTVRGNAAKYAVDRIAEICSE